MTSDINESLIFWENSKYLGIDFVDLYNKTGNKIAQTLIEDFGSNSSYSIICGLGGNAADGFAIALALVDKLTQPLNIYLIGRPQNFTNPITTLLWDKLYDLSKINKDIRIVQDCYSKDIVKSDIIIECLVGTGLEGTKLNKRFFDVIKRISHFESKIVAIDIACPHYTYDSTYSIMYPKSSDARTIEIDIPTELELFCGPGEKSLLFKPKQFSHKNKNGTVLYMSQNNQSDILIEEEAKEYTTNLYKFHFESSEKSENLNSSDLSSIISEANTILIGDTDEDIISFATLNYILDTYKDKTIILFGNSLNIVNLEHLKNRPNVLLVLNRFNIPEIFKTKNSNNLPIEGKLKRFSIETGINILLLGTQIYLYSPSGTMKMIRNTNATTNDDQIRLIAKIGTYSAVNDLWLSMRAAMA
jgi:NAD(P)H-hydrate repair Nnr-like enzyme with NAD(P)H-hydrate epimerase domain